MTEESIPTQPTHGASRGLLPTEFRIVGSGLRVRTPIDAEAQPTLAAFEAAHALLMNRQPQGAFVRSSFAVSLRSVLAERALPKATWDVVLGARISTRPPEGLFLLG